MPAMQCASCRAENRDEARFCRSCGDPLAFSCEGCGAELLPDSRFCDACGAEVGKVRRQTTPSDTASERSPLQYTPAHLASKILTSKSAMEGERKQVTVLFADIQRSTSLAESLDPEEWHTILNRFFQILTKGVHRFEGTVNQFTGDGIMALFGAPIAHEDHAQRACYAALLLQRGLRRYSQQLKRERGIALSVRMGLNSGDVVVGRIGDDLRMDYTAQGHTVNLASHIEKLASPDTSYLTANTAELVRGFFELEDLGPYRVKNVRDPVQVYELRGLGSLRTRLDLSRARAGTSITFGPATEPAPSRSRSRDFACWYGSCPRRTPESIESTDDRIRGSTTRCARMSSPRTGCPNANGASAVLGSTNGAPGGIRAFASPAELPREA